MTVKELRPILDAVDNENRVVYMDAYGTTEVNGYYYSKRDGNDAIIFTSLEVQPRIIQKNEVQGK